MAHPRLRQALEKGETVVAPSVYDAITARLIRYLGYEYLYCPGSQTGAVLGTSEPLTTVTQMADIGRTVVKGVRNELPVLLDAGAGFGEPVHVTQAVQTLELAGITAIHIEDQFYPKRASYHKGLEHIVPIDVYQQRLEYAVKARSSRDFLIIGRNDGMRAAPDPWLPEGGNRDEAVKRAHAAIEAGVDILFILGVRDDDDYKYLRSQIKDVPMMAIMGGTRSINDFSSWGYQVLVSTVNTLGASLAALRATYQSILDTGRPLEVDPEKAQEMREITNVLLDMEGKWRVEDATTEAAAAAAR
jgi:methylisocitrate lyase